MINTALIGFGLSAQTFHLPFITCNNNFALKAVVSSKPKSIEKLDGNVRCYPSIEKLIDIESLDLVIVTSPNDSHFKLSHQCLRAGINVVVEKPVALTKSETEELASLAIENSCLLIPFHNRRYDGDFLTLCSLIRDRKLGNIQFMESRMDRFRPTVGEKWKEQPGAGTGLWFDLGPHLLDQTLMLFGEPEAITANILQLREYSATPDLFEVSLYYHDKLIRLGANNMNAAPQKRFMLLGDNGTYVKTGLDPQEKQLGNGVSPLTSDFGVYSVEENGHLFNDTSRINIETRKGNYGDYYDAVANSILYNGPPPVTAEEAILVAKYIDMAIKSQELGKTIHVRKFRE